MIATNEDVYTEKKFDEIADMAARSLFYEVTLYPKPGLVDPMNSGAHVDMDYSLFLKSIAALKPFFHQYILLGHTHSGSLEALFTKLRCMGKLAEKKMFETTQGVNTHKGANFSFALILGAMGYLNRYGRFEKKEIDANTISEVLEIVRKMTRNLTQKDLKITDLKSQLSNGEAIYRRHKLKGIRGEAEMGYPMIERLALPYYRQNRKMSVREVLLKSLILLMSNCEDGNIIHRGGIESWESIKQQSEQLFLKNLSEEDLCLELDQMNQDFVSRNLSPGGSADLLAVSIFFGILEGSLENLSSPALTL